MKAKRIFPRTDVLMQVKQMKQKIMSLLLFLVTWIIPFFTVSTAEGIPSPPPAYLANYLGIGSEPRLYLRLAKNGANWSTYTIDYQGTGGVPYASTNPNDANNWSAFDIIDSTGDIYNYYGTISLTSDGTNVSFTHYSAPQNSGYFLEGIHFTPPNYSNPTNPIPASLAVDVIHRPTSGPFPNAPPSSKIKPVTYPGTTTAIMLSVSPTNPSRIINNMNAEITLKGVVRPSLEWNASGQYLSPEDIATMARVWKANAIRLDLNQSFWFSSAGVDVQGSYKQIINAIVYYAMSNGMAVILDLHLLTPGQQGTQALMANSNPGHVQDSIQFWSEVAAFYKDFGTVIFELFNEPHDISMNVWLNGDAALGYAGYQQLYNAVRATGAQNLCIINGLDYGYDLSFVNSTFGVQGTNIIYGSHPYCSKGHTFALLNENFKGVLGKFPLIFTEFGIDGNCPNTIPNGYLDIYNNIIQYAKTNKVNYTAFAWWVDAGNPNLFPDVISNWQGAPLNGGTLIQADMLNNPGTKLNGSASGLLKPRISNNSK